MCTRSPCAPTASVRHWADFQTTVEPPQSRPARSRGARKTTTTLYGEFYRRLVARLRRNGVRPVGKGGWRGRWRSFQTGHPDAIYGTGVDERKAKVFLRFKGSDHRRRFQALFERREGDAAPYRLGFRFGFAVALVATDPHMGQVAAIVGAIISSPAQLTA